MSSETPSDPFDRYISPGKFGALAHPVDVAMARASARSLVGLGTPRGPVAARREWWDLMRLSETPEQRLTCQRMIDALGEAIGLQDWAEGQAVFRRLGQPPMPSMRGRVSLRRSPNGLASGAGQEHEE